MSSKTVYKGKPMPARNISREQGQQEMLRNQLSGTKQTQAWGSKKRMKSSTLCKSSSNRVTRAVAIDRCPAAQVYHLVQAQLSAVDGGSLGLQGNDQLLGILRRGHSCLWETRDQTLGWGAPQPSTPSQHQGGCHPSELTPRRSCWRSAAQNCPAHTG